MPLTKIVVLSICRHRFGDIREKELVKWKRFKILAGEGITEGRKPRMHRMS